MLRDSEKKGLIVIKIANLSLGEHCYDFQCTAADFDDTELSEQVFPAPIAVKVVLTKTTSELVAEIAVETKVRLECDRCLAPIQKDLTGLYKIFYLMSHIERHNTNDEDDDVRQIDRNTVDIDLTEDVRETLLLSIPIKNVCENPETCGPEAGKAETVTYHSGEDSASEQEETEWQKALKQLENKLNTNKKREI